MRDRPYSHSCRWRFWTANNSDCGRPSWSNFQGLASGGVTDRNLSWITDLRLFIQACGKHEHEQQSIDGFQIARSADRITLTTCSYQSHRNRNFFRSSLVAEEYLHLRGVHCQEIAVISFEGIAVLVPNIYGHYVELVANGSSCSSVHPRACNGRVWCYVHGTGALVVTCDDSSAGSHSL